MAIVLNGTSGAQIPLGTAAAPSATNTTAQATGLYFPSSTTLGLSTNGTAALTIDASQNVGIGTTSPNTKFVVSNAGAAGLEIAPTGFSSAPSIVSYNRSGAAYTQLTLDASVNVFAISGTERMRLDSSGNLGIGTTSPSTFGKTAILTSAGSGSGGPASTQTNSVLSLSGTTTGAALNLGIDATGTAYGWIQARNSGSATYYDLALQPSGGNVGIGTSSPAASLSVVKQATALSGTGNLYGLYMYPTSSGLTYIDAITGSTGNTSLGFRTYNNGTYNEMRMDSSGNVGIGTSSPANKLDVRGETNISSTANWNFAALNVIRTSSNTSTPRAIAMPLGGDDLASTTIGGYNAIWGIYNASPTSSSTSSALQGEMAYAAYYGHRWYNNGSERMRIDSSGNLLVGTTSAPAAGNMRVSTPSSGVSIQLERTSTSAGSGFIGADSANAFNVYNGSVVQRFYVTQAGACFNSTGTYGTISDLKIKENIVDARGYLDDLCRVRIVKYSLKEDHKLEADKLGVIAQELEQIFPNMIEETQDFENGAGDPTGETTKTVKYSVFVPMLIKAIQELKAELDALKGTK